MSEKNEVTRSEQVRLRREQEQKKRMNRIVKEASRPMPPVTARTKVNTQRNKAAKPRQNARRRFQVVIPVAPTAARPVLGRANFRSFSIPRPQFGWRFVSLIVTLALGALLYLAFSLPQLRVTQAELVGNQVLTAADVNAVLNITGRPIFLIKPSELETRLRLNYPELVSVQVSLSLPNVVTVNVLERRPLIRWEQGGGYTWVAEDGIAFKPRGEMGDLISVVAESAPPVEGNGFDPLNPAPFISSDMVMALKGLANHVPPGQSIIYDARMGFGWNDPRGWKVYFGATGADIEMKMRVYESLVNSLTQRGIHPAMINVTYASAPYYRMTP